MLLQGPDAEVEPAIVPMAPLIDRDEMDFDNNFYDIGDGDLSNGGTTYGTVDGLRRRIPELHEDFPPDALSVETQQDETP